MWHYDTLWLIHWYSILRINLGLPDTARHPEFRPFWGGDILQAAEEGNVGAVRRLLQVDPQSLEQVDGRGGNLRRDRLEGWAGCYRCAAVTSQSVADTGFSRNMTDLWLCAWCRHHQRSLRPRDGCDRTDVVGRRCNRRNVEEMRHAIEFAASFGIVPGIFSVLYAIPCWEVKYQ